MAATIDTQFGQVTTSAPYFSHQLGCEVINLTLIKPENDNNGWGISRECPSNVSLTNQFLNMFARDAAQVM
ncbi:hypothetical protein GTP59_19830 [Vibrio alginolyticus]|nr:hypothetical protein [Vibrio alginolyticus]